MLFCGHSLLLKFLLYNLHDEAFDFDCSGLISHVSTQPNIMQVKYFAPALDLHLIEPKASLKLREFFK
jgi:hypothetical protein